MKKTNTDGWYALSLIKGFATALTGAVVNRIKKDEKDVDPDIQRGRMFLDVLNRMDNIW